MNEAVSRQTREILGQVIRKPPLTDALLSKPPFRYLHDLISEVIRVTGFLKGLYTDFELKSDNVKDKDSKINFLQKAIDAVVMVTGEPLSVKPTRVVAGHEPEKTNEFLQAIGKCCLNKLSSDAAVKRVLAGEKADLKGKPPPSKPQDKESREPKAEHKKSHRDKESRRDAEVKDRSPSRDRKPKGDLKESREREKEREKQKNNEERHKEPERDTSKEGEKQERERSKSKMTKQGRETEKTKEKGDLERGDYLGHDKGQEREKRHEVGREKDRLKGRQKDKARDREGEKDRERGRDRGREKDGEHFREHGKEKAEKKTETPAGIPKQPSAKGSGHRSKPRGEGNYREDIVISIKCAGGLLRAVDLRSVADEISEDGAAALQEKNEPGLPEKQKDCHGKPSWTKACVAVSLVKMIFPPSHCYSRQIPRPGSARPAPPRVKRQESTELLIPERSGSTKTAPNVIRDQQVSDEEDEQFVVEEVVPLPEMPKVCTACQLRDARLDLKTSSRKAWEKKGASGLVKRILETKKDYEASQTTDTEASRKRERDLAAKEIEKLQASIQNVCMNVCKLTRMLDYIQEDMDAMRDEMLMWRQEYKECREVLKKEQSITDGVLEPLRAELAEWEQRIEDQRAKIRAVKANVLRNDEKMDRMIRSISSPS
ncbi:MIPT3 protein, partial [Rhadina sibilatrix]|nr:MIPT3 protein [Rhadina sibilatrix]